MIYRLLVEDDWFHDRLKPAGNIMGQQMCALGLGGAKKWYWQTNCKFFFTEKGWKEVGKKLAGEAIRAGLQIKILKLKNPKRSEILYKDAMQVVVQVGDKTQC